MTMAIEEDEYEKELDEQIQAIDKANEEAEANADASTEAIPEGDPKPEDEAPPPDKPDDDADSTVADDDKGKADESETEPEPVKETEEEPDHPTVPIARLSEETRGRRRAEREVRAANDKNAELEAELASLKAQAEVQGVELHNSKKGFTEEDRESLTEEFGADHANSLIALQAKQDAADQAKADQAKANESLALAIENNDTANEIHTANGADWAKMRELWAENEAALYRDFKNDDERIAHVVKLMEKPKAPVSEKPAAANKGPARTLNNVPGDTAGGGDEVDQVMAMGDAQIDYMEKLEESNPDKYERIMKGLSERGQ